MVFYNGADTSGMLSKVLRYTSGNQLLVELHMDFNKAPSICQSMLCMLIDAGLRAVFIFQSPIEFMWHFHTTSRATQTASYTFTFTNFSLTSQKGVSQFMYHSFALIRDSTNAINLHVSLLA